MAEPPSRRRPITVPIQTTRVEGTIELTEIVSRIHSNAASEARRAKRDPAVPEHVEQRFRNVSRLAQQLADELHELEQTGRLPPAPRRTRRRQRRDDR
jgi:hypothetical protein